MELTAATFRTAIGQIEDCARSFDGLAASKRPWLFGRADADATALTQLGELIDQTNGLAAELAGRPGHAPIADVVRGAVELAEGGRVPGADVRDAARAAAAHLRTANELPSELRIRELFARPAESWTPAETNELVGLLDHAPEHLRISSGPYKHNGSKYSFADIAGWLHKSRDSVDIHMTNRYAAAWRLTHDPALTREQVTARALAHFERDARDWSPQDAGEVAAIFNDMPDHLRPEGGPMRVLDQNYRAKLDGARGQAYDLPSISEWLTLSHDDTDILLNNQYAEAWLATAPQSRPRALDQMRAWLDHDVPVPGRRPTGISIDAMGTELLGEVDGLQRARRAAGLLEYAVTREQVEQLLAALDESLPKTAEGPIGSLLADTRSLVATNSDRNLGRAAEAELKAWHKRGFDTHVDFGELGSIRANVRALAAVLDQPAADATVAADSQAVAEARAAGNLSW